MASSWYILALLFAAVAMTQCSLLDFGKMIKYVTGKNPLNYLLYGCYCGLGGFGHPKDKTDWCCHKHDCCYGHLGKIGCKSMSKRYRFDVMDHKIICDAHKNYYCARRICECDRAITLCFKENLRSFSKEFENYDKRAKCNQTELDCSKYKF
uniref:Phospholipase A2 n=1 Tax=Leptobrachium leishanense TaxID=445787 RepID=A0A8C5QAG3_9ANUR